MRGVLTFVRYCILNYDDDDDDDYDNDDYDKEEGDDNY